MGRRGVYGGPTVEQTRSIEIDVLRRAGYAINRCCSIGG
jgi:hypothetical protein